MNKCILALLIFPLNILLSQTNYWELTNGPYGGTINDYAIDSSGVIFGGTPNGVFRSTDSGITWSYSGLQGNEVYSVCKSSSGVILAGAYRDQLYRSTNNGLNWQSSNLYVTYIPDLAEVQPGILIAATIQGIFKTTNEGLNWSQTLSNVTAYSIAKSPADNKVYVSCYNGIYSSSDMGSTWSVLDSMKYTQLRSINIADNGFIFVASWDFSLFRSTNNGQSFTILEEDSIYEPSCVTSTSNGFVYCGTSYEGIWRSTDYGETWNQLNYGRDVFNLVSGFNNEVFASIGGLGSVKTTDNGLNWITSVQGIVNSRIGAIIKARDGKIISSYGQISYDNGMNWVTPQSPLVAIDLAINNVNGFIYAVIGSNNLFRSTDNGDSWQFFNVHSLYGLVMLSVHRSGDVYAGGGGSGIYKSINDGVNWVQFTAPTAPTFSSLAKNSLNHYFAGGIQGIYRSTNEGSNWSLVLPLSNNTGYYFNPVIVTQNDVLYAGGTEGIYSSTNDGSNWIHEGSTGKVSEIIETRNGSLFITCYDYYTLNNGGVFKKSGSTWQNLTFDLINRNIIATCFNENGQMLVSTSGSGIMRSIEPVIGINNITSFISDDYNLFQNYPNPFNPVTNIQFSLPKDNFVTLKIYNVSGEELYTLVNEHKSAGTYQVPFDGNDLSSGIYFYKLSAGRYAQTRKMTLIK